MILKIQRVRAAKLIVVGCIAVALQGCVAVAFPIAAGGLLAGGVRMDATDEGEPASATTTTAAADPSPATASAPESAQPSVQPGANPHDSAENEVDVQDPVVAVAENNEAPAIAEPVAKTEPVAAPMGPTQTTAMAANDRADVAPGPIPAQPAPAPTPAQASAPAPNAGSGIVIPVPQAAPPVAGGTFFDPLFAYAMDPAFMRSDARPSATLVDPTALKPNRIECSEGVSTVLIDLDPEEGELFPIDPRSASSALAERLAQLRVKGIGIAWISQSSADRADEIRGALYQSGLDQLGTDEVLLMRNSDERKQTRRDELARNTCLVAMAGDTRSDFHELFEYLLNPRDAAALEPLIGEGWFLIPTPLLPERAAP